MKPIDIPFNIQCRLNDDLQEVPDSESEMIQAITLLEEKLAEEQDENEQMILSSTLGKIYRVLGRLEIAEDQINMALGISNALQDEQARFRNLVQLAQIYQAREDFTFADQIYEHVVMACEHSHDASNPDAPNPFADYLHHAYEHEGLSKFGQQKYMQALGFFEKALAIRQSLNDQALIDATNHTIEVTRRRMVADSE